MRILIDQLANKWPCVRLDRVSAPVVVGVEFTRIKGQKNLPVQIRPNFVSVYNHSVYVVDDFVTKSKIELGPNEAIGQIESYPIV